MFPAESSIVPSCRDHPAAEFALEEEKAASRVEGGRGGSCELVDSEL
jgi:hypothetical protein